MGSCTFKEARKVTGSVLPRIDDAGLFVDPATGVPTPDEDEEYAEETVPIVSFVAGDPRIPLSIGVDAELCIFSSSSKCLLPLVLAGGPNMLAGACSAKAR